MPEMPVSVLVVDDSAVVRGMVIRILQEEPQIEVKATAANGQAAIDIMKQQSFDAVLLDVEMPVMSGLEALPELVKLVGSGKIIMNSTLTVEGGEVTMKALRLGAADYIAKPSSRDQNDDMQRFAQDLKQKVLELGRAAQRARGIAKGTIAAASIPAVSPMRPVSATTSRLTTRPRVLAIGSSTGGPQALFKVFEGLKGTYNVPILITQHMPAGFTKVLAEHIAKASGRICTEAVDGETLINNRIYVAPGNYHMTVEGAPESARIRLLTTPPENFCRPSVDPMLRSVVQVYGASVLFVMLTGMGQDGLEGAKRVASSGGAVIAQDEATSVVWGMPGAVAKAGICKEVLPLGDIPVWVNQAFGMA